MSDLEAAAKERELAANPYLPLARILELAVARAEGLALAETPDGTRILADAGLGVRIVGATGRAARAFIPAGQTGTPRGTDLRKEFPVGTIVEAKGNEEIEYDGEMHTAANLFDALKEGYYGKF